MAMRFICFVTELLFTVRQGNVRFREKIKPTRFRSWILFALKLMSRLSIFKAMWRLTSGVAALETSWYFVINLYTQHSEALIFLPSGHCVLPAMADSVLGSNPKLTARQIVGIRLTTASRMHETQVAESQRKSWHTLAGRLAWIDQWSFAKSSAGNWIHIRHRMLRYDKYEWQR